jgi:hypothetical protein
MAPIYGRPRRDFVARVMAGIDAPAHTRPARRRAPARILVPALAAPALAAAAVVLAAMAVLWRAADVTWPATSAPPHRIAAPFDSPRIVVAGAGPGGQPERAARIAPRQMAAPAIAPIAEPRIPVIDALVGPAQIALDTIDPLPSVVPALPAPAPLTITSLRISKEKP